ncbi:hypothetical protein BCV69DRAFT_298935 [Microstroma glucosiphilum]|uniref:Uncharacterized protein n=1 Tax=Pseudomicrostroma glucosiphilum TaxID=1684307 RepID=A0A316U7E1_9BASI|nr:hypothetical protein BCV69DRAFT_298935 [Pseudomicrostroma glucosiphilum]PWN21157.1 hypothetical protein BCV69DRAFT_298935 [Pseudomicrostroma glucosiphilum]
MTTFQEQTPVKTSRDVPRMYKGEVRHLFIPSNMSNQACLPLPGNDPPTGEEHRETWCPNAPLPAETSASNPEESVKGVANKAIGTAAYSANRKRTAKGIKKQK